MNTQDAQEKEGAHDHERHSWKYSGIPGIRQYQSSSLFFFPLFPFFPSQTKSNLSSHSLRIIDRSKTSINLYISRYVQENEERDEKEREELELDSCHAFVTVNCHSLQIIDRSKTSINLYISRASISSSCEPLGLQDLVQRSTILNAPPLNQRYQTTNTKHRPESMTRQQPELLSEKKKTNKH